MADIPGTPLAKGSVLAPGAMLAAGMLATGAMVTTGTLLATGAMLTPGRTLAPGARLAVGAMDGHSLAIGVVTLGIGCSLWLLAIAAGKRSRDIVAIATAMDPLRIMEHLICCTAPRTRREDVPRSGIIGFRRVGAVQPDVARP